MNKRKLMISVISILSSFYLFSGCTQKEMNDAANEIGSTVEDGLDKARTGVEDTMDWFTNINFEDMAYNSSDLKASLESKGKTVEVTPMEKGYFTAPRQNFKVDLGEFHVYEYPSDQKENLISDIRKITDNGMLINGEKITWAKTPNFYKKGRIIVLYDGDNKDMLLLLESILGAPFIGNKPS